MNNLNYLNEMIELLQNLLEDLKSLRDGNELNSEVLSKSPVLNGWSQTTRSTACLEGVVQEHPRLGKSKVILTSDLYYLDPEMRFARTLSRYYRLGKPAKFKGLR
ncbi:DUF6634 family protein [Brucella thiophenivorans]|uniref:Uncharacterized protein n=1 Tax=Brucella thiophenivorans TaxID=571255 RepID=A0A256FK75_9HYPH|nr:DUF6634 family protein [Brucella thiophenivorans]OYR15237.1 hypothetical protein CEV31_3154 [Brucella thiophenivorans]